MPDKSSFDSKKLLRVAALIAGTVAGVIIALRLGLFLLPFVIALAVSYIINPLIKFLMGRLRFSRKLASAFSLLLVLACFGFILTGLISRLLSELKSVALYITEAYKNGSLTAGIEVITNRANDIYLWLPKEVTDNIGSLASNLSTSLAKLVDPVVKGAFSTAFSIPEALIFTLVTILSTYFFSSDREKIISYFESHLPDNWIRGFSGIRKNMFSALFGYLRALLILMSITFTELFIGFSIMGVKHGLLLAFVIAIIDALPILGTGGVLIPWAAYQMLTGDFRLGLSLLILYGIVLVVRQVIEPKIVGEQIGLHPLITLMSMYTGLQLLGFAGLILGPITILLLKNVLTGIYGNGIIKEVFGKSNTHKAKDQV